MMHWNGADVMMQGLMQKGSVAPGDGQGKC
jgi:hypothetical protein